MTPVTDPNIIAQLEGSAPQAGLKPVTDPAVIAQLEGGAAPQQETAPFYQRIVPDIVSGLATAGQGLHNFMLSSFPSAQTHIDFGKEVFGVNKPNLADNLIQGAAQYAPYAVAQEAAAPAKALSFGQKLLSDFATGGVFGTTQSDDPVKGGLISAITAPAARAVGAGVGKAGGLIFGTKGAQDSIGNTVIDQLNKASKAGGALTPEEAAENLATNYSNQQGQPLNADIGTVANNPTLKKMYEALKYVPFSGVSKNKNIVNNALYDKAIGEVKDQLGAEANNPSADLIKQNYSDQISNVENSLKQSINNPTAGLLSQQYSDLLNVQSKYSDALAKAPNYLNSLASGVPDRSNITQSLKNDVLGLYKDNKKTAESLYEPINNSKFRLDTAGVDNPFQNYGAAASELLAKRENLQNLFGKDSDLGSKLNSEIDKAESFLNNGNQYGVTLQEAVDRIKTLGRLSANAAAQGNRHEAMLIGNLRDGLTNDTHTVLEKSGNGDLSNALLQANDYYKKNVVPFWNNNEINKTVSDKNYISPQAKLSKALHDPNNQSILNQLPNDSQSALLYQLVTGGKGTSSGYANFDAKDIASAYSKLPVDTKRAIASYNPNADKLFENLPNVLNTHAQIEQAKSTLADQINALSKNSSRTIEGLQSQLEKLKNKMDSDLGKNSEKSTKRIDSLQDQLEALKNKKYGADKQSSFGADKLAGTIKGGAIGAGLLGGYLSPLTMAASVPFTMASRNLAKALTNPDLIQAYIAGTKLPVNQQQLLNPFITNNLRGLPAALSNGGGQQ